MSVSTDQWYCRLAGAELGPLPFEMLRKMIATQKVGPDDQVRTTAAERWQEVRDVAPLRLLLSGAQSDLKEADVHAGGLADNSLPDEWYCRIDGRVRGPYTEAALRKLIQAGGEAAPQTLVRRAHKNWAPFCELLSSSDMPSERTSNAASAQPREAVLNGAMRCELQTRVKRSQTFSDWLQNNGDLKAIAAVWLVFNLGWMLWQPPWAYKTEKEYFATLRLLELDVKTMQQLEHFRAPPEEIKRFCDKVNRAVEPIIRDLDHRDCESQPILRHLRLATHQLPVLVGPGGQARKDAQRLYKKSMDSIEPELASD